MPVSSKVTTHRTSTELLDTKAQQLLFENVCTKSPVHLRTLNKITGYHVVGDVLPLPVIDLDLRHALLPKYSLKINFSLNFVQNKVDFYGCTLPIPNIKRLGVIVRKASMVSHVKFKN